MTSTIKLPRMLEGSVRSGLSHGVVGTTVQEALDHLFQSEPGLRGHLLDERGAIRPHVSIFVDGDQANLETPVGETAEIRVLHAVSGGRQRV